MEDEELDTFVPLMFFSAASISGPVSGIEYASTLADSIASMHLYTHRPVEWRHTYSSRETNVQI